MTSSEKMKERAKDNPFIAPRSGIEFDVEGPHADYLIDNAEIYDRIVYPHIRTNKDEWEVSNESDAQPYLPKRKVPLTVTLGIEEKKSTDLPTFGSLHLPDYLKYKKGYVLNTGSSIWGLDFVPKIASIESDPLTQYLAVSGYKGAAEEHVGMNEIQPTGTYKNCIQIWKLKLSTKAQEEPLLDLCLLHDYGVVFDLKWCPYGAYEEEGTEELPKLGILTFSCGDGTVRTIVVPHPTAVRKHTIHDHNPSKTVYLKVKSPRRTFAISGGNAMNLAWGGHKKLAAGCTFGTIVVWNMEEALADNQSKSAEEAKRFIQMSVLLFDATVANIAWNGIKNPERLIAGGYDGQIKIVDLNDPFVPFLVARTRGIAKAVGWAHYDAPFLLVDTDGNFRGSKGSENDTLTTLKYLETPGIHWDIGTSPHHGQFVTTTAVGYVKSSNMYQIRSKTLMAQQITIYKLNYSEDTKSFRYTDGIPPKKLEETRQLSKDQLYGETLMAIQKVVWNPNKRTSAFIASGGSSGLCRIEFEGRGTKWE